jgi:hypothetical protein
MDGRFYVSLRCDPAGFHRGSGAACERCQAGEAQDASRLCRSIVVDVAKTVPSTSPSGRFLHSRFFSRLFCALQQPFGTPVVE